MGNLMDSLHYKYRKIGYNPDKSEENRKKYNDAYSKYENREDLKKAKELEEITKKHADMRAQQAAEYEAEQRNEAELDASLGKMPVGKINAVITKVFENFEYYTQKQQNEEEETHLIQQGETDEAHHNEIYSRYANNAADDGDDEDEYSDSSVKTETTPTPDEDDDEYGDNEYFGEEENGEEENDEEAVEKIVVPEFEKQYITSLCESCYSGNEQQAAYETLVNLMAGKGLGTALYIQGEKALGQYTQSGSEADRKKAVELFKSAREKGSSCASWRLWQIYDDMYGYYGKDEQGLGTTELHREVKENPCAPAMYQLVKDLDVDRMFNHITYQNYGDALSKTKGDGFAARWYRMEGWRIMAQGLVKNDYFGAAKAAAIYMLMYLPPEARFELLADSPTVEQVVLRAFSDDRGAVHIADALKDYNDIAAERELGIEHEDYGAANTMIYAEQLADIWYRVELEHSKAKALLGDEGAAFRMFVFAKNYSNGKKVLDYSESVALAGVESILLPLVNACKKNMIDKSETAAMLERLKTQGVEGAQYALDMLNEAGDYNKNVDKINEITQRNLKNKPKVTDQVMEEAGCGTNEEYTLFIKSYKKNTKVFCGEEFRMLDNLDYVEQKRIEELKDVLVREVKQRVL